MSVVITAAPTGPIASKADNQTLPTQPPEIAEAGGHPLSPQRRAEPGNLPLVQRAVDLATALNRPAASVDETAALLRLPPR